MHESSSCIGVAGNVRAAAAVGQDRSDSALFRMSSTSRVEA